MSDYVPNEADLSRAAQRLVDTSRMVTIGPLVPLPYPGDTFVRDGGLFRVLSVTITDDEGSDIVAERIG